MAAHDLSDQSVFARTAAWSLGAIEGDTPEIIAEQAWKLVAESRRYVNRLHIFSRDPCVPGDRIRGGSRENGLREDTGFEPGITAEDRLLHKALFETAPQAKFLGVGAADLEHPALLEETVLDIVRVDPGRCMAGLHTIMAGSPIQAHYPGGVIPIQMPTGASERAVSRAWLKFEEGLRWAGFPIGQGTCCLDIGASPGGGSQALLSRGAKVIGVDPAEMAPQVLSHPNFTHIRGRINQTKRSQYKNVRWVISDMNVAPNYTFDVLEELLARPDAKIQGMLFTLKLFQWSLADDLTKTIAWFRRWRFDEVRIKQLAFNRQEVMVAALKKRG